MPGRIRKRLLVEGNDDKRVIPEIIEANGIPWGETRDQAIVDIKEYDGIDNLLNVLPTEMKAGGLEILGIMADADENVEARWNQIRNRCLSVFPDLPERFPEEGLIHSERGNLRFGVWIMPDNKTGGMLETFLAYLVPDQQIDTVWKHAEKSLKKAINLGIPCKEAHYDKAKIHTWLAWQNPPGRQLHNAVIEKIFVPTHPKSKKFTQWFRHLYEI